MSINATLLIEVIAFLLFIWSFKQFLWTPILNAMQARDKRIADGLASADRGQQYLENAKQRASEILKEARDKSLEIVEQANRRATEIVGEAKGQALSERKRQVEAGKAEIQQGLNRAKEALRAQVANIAVAAAGRIIEREIDPRAHKALLDELARQIH